MKVQTKYLGEIEAKKDDFFLFQNGLPGFPDETEFILLDFPGNIAFQLLQSVKTAELAFVVTNPHLFYQDYTQKLDDAIIQTLRIEKAEDVALYSIVTVKQPFAESTINLKAPIVVNTKNRQGKQYISNESHYSSQALITPKQKGVE